MMKVLALCAVASAAITPLPSTEDIAAVLAKGAVPPYNPRDRVADPIGSVQGVIARVLGQQYVTAFQLQVISADPATGNDAFELGLNGSTVVLRGNSGVSIASALNYYLNNYCNSSVMWGRNGTGNQLSSLPPPSALPAPAATRVVSPVKWRYYQNVCTVSYSMAWWNWTQWEQELDRMAMLGITLPLAFTGQEYVWRAFYLSLGLTDADLNAFFSSPAFLAWQRMGNIKGAWGPGPLPLSFINGQAALQQQILARMTQLGMHPVLPGFAGHVPDALQRIYPNASFTRTSDWAGFDNQYSGVLFLEPSDPLFVPLATKFYQTLIAQFGASGFYNTDQYNEMTAPTDPNVLKQANAAVWTAMSAADPTAVYVLQGWAFYSGNWAPEMVQGYLSAVPDDNILVLDLWTEENPVWSKFQSYYGRQWAWNLLHTFGGRRALVGNLSLYASGPILDKAASPNMVAIGLTPEAIDTNPIVYDLMLQMGWRSELFDVSAWVQQWAVRRYGRYSPSASQAWSILQSAAYNQHDPYTYGQSAIMNAPDFGQGAPDGATNVTGVLEAYRLLWQAGANGEVPMTGPYSYDLTDVGREFLNRFFSDVLRLQGFIINSYILSGGGAAGTAKWLDPLLAVDAALQGIIADLDTLLRADVNFLFGTWTADARAWGNTPAEVALMEYSARNQVTMWGPTGQINDYAAKNGWAGLVGDYYGGRWREWCSFLETAVSEGTIPTSDQWYNIDIPFEKAFSNGTEAYPTTPEGDPIAIAGAVIAKYATLATPPTYSVTPNMDAPNNDMIEPGGMWFTDIAVMQWLCSVVTECAGIVLSPDGGFLKTSVSSTSPYTGATLYTKIAKA